MRRNTADKYGTLKILAIFTSNIHYMHIWYITFQSNMYKNETQYCVRWCSCFPLPVYWVPYPYKVRGVTAVGGENWEYFNGGKDQVDWDGEESVIVREERSILGVSASVPFIFAFFSKQSFSSVLLQTCKRVKLLLLLLLAICHYHHLLLLLLHCSLIQFICAWDDDYGYY